MFLYPRSMHCISSTCKGSFYVTSLFRNLNLVCTLASNLQKHEHKFNDFESFEWRHEHLRYTHSVYFTEKYIISAFYILRCLALLKIAILGLTLFYQCWIQREHRGQLCPPPRSCPQI